MPSRRRRACRECIAGGARGRVALQPAGWQADSSTLSTAAELSVTLALVSGYLSEQRLRDQRALETAQSDASNGVVAERSAMSSRGHDQ